MSTDAPVTEVFEDVEPDPDAILEAWDAETPAELVASGGRHGTNSDDEIDDVTAAELFADLGDEDVADPTPRDADPDSDGLQIDDSDPDSDRIADLGFEFVGDSAATLRNDGDVTDATAAVPSWTLTVRDGSTDELELVGPEPTRTRVANDAFGSSRLDAQ